GLHRRARRRVVPIDEQHAFRPGMHLVGARKEVEACVVDEQQRDRFATGRQLLQGDESGVRRAGSLDREVVAESSRQVADEVLLRGLILVEDENHGPGSGAWGGHERMHESRPLRELWARANSWWAGPFLDERPRPTSIRRIPRPPRISRREVTSTSSERCSG